MLAGAVAAELLSSKTQPALHFVKRHVQIHAHHVAKTLYGRDMEESRELVLDFLDGYLLWLDDGERSAFKRSFYVSTTYIPPAGDFDPPDPPAPTSVIDSAHKKRLKSFAYTTSIPKTAEAARRNLEAYLVLWRTIFSLSETAAHAPNRVAQLYDWELMNHGPVNRLCRLLARPPHLWDDPVPLLDEVSVDFKAHGISLTDADITDFYQDGLKLVEARKALLDDLNDCATFRITPSRCKTQYVPYVDDAPIDGAGGPASATPTLPRLKPWLRKSFYEPEGVKAGVVALRNYYPVMYFNVYLTLAAWAWFNPAQVTAKTMVIADGVSSTLGALIEFFSRFSVYPCRSMCVPSLPWWSLGLTFVTYIVGLAEIGLWYLGSSMKVLPAAYLQYMYLGAFGASIILRALHNLLLFAKFPSISRGHHKRPTKSFKMLNRMFWKNLIFFVITAGILVPLYYWFVVPTLERSAFWTFCAGEQLVTEIQCYIGILGLWIPLLSVILIMDFISYAVVLSFYGAYIAMTNHVGAAADELSSSIHGLQSFNKLLNRWIYQDYAVNFGAPSMAVDLDDMAKSSSSKEASGSTSATTSTDVTPSSSTSTKSTKSKKSKSKSKPAPKVARSSPDHTIISLDDPNRMPMKIWYLIVDDLLDMDLISKDTQKNLQGLNWQDVPMGSKPHDIIQFFISSLSSLPPELVNNLPKNYLRKLPALTQLIPSYGESVVFETSYLCNHDKKPVSNLEFLVLKYPKEWEYLYQRMKIAYGGTSVACFGSASSLYASPVAASPPSSYAFPESSDEMLRWFLQNGVRASRNEATQRHMTERAADESRFWAPMHPDLHDEIRLWASLRGQTLYRTIRGALSYRMALTALYEATNHSPSLVAKKCQLILAHQQYGDPSMLRQVARDVLLIYKRLSCPKLVGRHLYGDTPFDLVFDWSPRDLMAQNSFKQKLSVLKNAEQINRYDLTSIFNDTEKICKYGEALAHLIDAKAGFCPITVDPKLLGSPFASVLAGLPTATRATGKVWLFRYKGNPRDLLNGGGDLGDGGGMFGGFGGGFGGGDQGGSDDEEESDSMDSHSNDKKRAKKKPETYKWENLAFGSAVVHATIAANGHVSEETPGWLRCFHEDTGREFDFLLRHESIEVFGLDFFQISARALHLRGTGPFSDMNHSEESLASKSGDSNGTGGRRLYIAVKFGIRHPAHPERRDVFSLVSCVNDDQFDDIIASSSLHSYDPYDDEGRSTMLHIAERLRASETSLLQRAMTKSINQANNSYRVDGIDENRLTTKGKQCKRSMERLRFVLLNYSTADLFHSNEAPVSDALFLGIEVKTVMPRKNPLIMRVAGELPFGDADRIQGKAANQMNGLRYAFGLVVQAKDANQGGNVCEALKFPIVLSKFQIHLARDREDHIKHWESWARKTFASSADYTKALSLVRSPPNPYDQNDAFLLDPASMDGTIVQNSLEMENLAPDSRAPHGTRALDFDNELIECSVPLEEQPWPISMEPPCIIGFRESVFTSTHGAIARFQAYAEWAFGTIVQRVLAKLGVRMHYGHPDFFSASWIFSRSAMSKANPIYNLSEDIFAGYLALLNDRRSTHTDKIQDEKGRDTSLPSTYTFTAKLAQGAASQMKSRDVFAMNTRLDFLRQFLLFHSSLGYYFTTTAMLSSVKMYLFGLLVFSLAGYSAENLGNMQFIYSVPFLVQVGMFTLLPLILEVAVEEGVWSVLKVVVDLPFSLGYFLFQGQTTTHHLIESFSKGKSHYEATGRLLGISRKSLIDLYQLYGKSHFEPALDYLFYIVVYYIVSSSRFGGYLPLFAPIICVVVFIIAPSGFQLGMPLKTIFNDVGQFGRWIFTTESYGALLKEWRTGPMRDQLIRNLTWKPTFKTTHTRLQTYSIFNSLKSIMTTHWRVDFGAAVAQLFRVVLWGFIVVSVPGGMKDSVLKILIAFLLYILLAMGISSITPHNKEGCLYSLSNLLAVITISYFVALLVILKAWNYVGDCVVGVFLSIKFLKALFWMLFHFYALFEKMNVARQWRRLEAAKEAKRLEPGDFERLTKELKSTLEKHVIAGLYLVDSVDRPVLLISLSAVLVPVHILWNLFWSLPVISHVLMYSIRLKPKVAPEDLIRTNHMRSVAGLGGGAFNTFAGPVDIEELPAFDFDGEGEFYY